MHCLSDMLLLDTYERAIALQLDEQFIELLELEIYRRNLQAQLRICTTYC